MVMKQYYFLGNIHFTNFNKNKREVSEYKYGKTLSFHVSNLELLFKKEIKGLLKNIIGNMENIFRNKYSSLSRIHKNKILCMLEQ